MDARQHLADSLVRDLVGPTDGPDEMLERKPSAVYLVGAVYPLGFRGRETQPEDEGDPMKQTSKFYPSAIGLSLLVRSNARIRIEGTFGSYKKDSDKRWHRTEHHLNFNVDGFLNPLPETGSHKFADADHAEVAISTRSTPDKNLLLLTVMVVNRHHETDDADEGKILFQSQVRVHSSVPVEPFSHQNLIPPEEVGLSDEEDEDLAFMYREHEPLAHGHGTAVDWSEDLLTVQTSAIPAVLVHALRSDPEHLSGLDLTIETLSGPKGQTQLNALINGYESWTVQLGIKLRKEYGTSRHAAASERIIDKQNICLKRIREGLALVTTEEKYSNAWKLALKAMALQFARPAVSGGSARVEPRLRPFQVAYALLVLPGLGEQGASNPSRPIVDLLWFPTGGGKTEAYLLVVLLEAFLRRIEHPDDYGCVAISRYTYRMLALDQFSRAASAICAAELVRQSSELALGQHSFSAGLWIGSSLTPNKLQQVDPLDYQGSSARGEQPQPWREKWLAENPGFPLASCPWCGTKLDLTTSYLIVDVANTDFKLLCPEESCPFSTNKGLPISIIDDHVYHTLPTIVIATADKLARLPIWNRKEGPVLLRGRDTARPVSLLVFDELHLLSGPLGTIASLYEVAVNAIIASATPKHFSPKVIASTATIRTAGLQAKNLLGYKLATFPVSGATPDDSYWAVRDDRPETARLYLGAMTTGSTWQALYVWAQTSIFRSVSTMPHELRNPYWTSVVYANTLRDHGRAVSLLANDVRNQLAQFEEDDPRVLQEIEELRGDRVGKSIAQILEKMKVGYSEVANRALDAVVTTNLIQVGVDVQRLGLMILLGQPKGTAEYIQATSRVGRSAAASGVILSLFQHTKPRDRSHYELFKTYHEALYRSVEPISVTPLAVPSLERSIRAVFAAIARHAIAREDSLDDDAKSFGADRDRLTRVEQRILEGARSREDGIADMSNVEKLLAQLGDEWHSRANGDQPLIWADSSRSLNQFPHLLKQRFPPSSEPGWPVDSSLRNVEGSVTIPITAYLNLAKISEDPDVQN
jgi:hypothetical protein